MRGALAMLAILLGPATVAAPRPELLVSGAKLTERLSDPAVAVVHVAPDRATYERGHVPGARYLPLSSVAAPRDGLGNELPPAADMVAALRGVGLGTSERIVLYGEDGGIAAARAFVALDYLGAGERAALLDGGLIQWRAEGRPLTDQAPRVEPGSFLGRPRPEALVSRHALLDLAMLAPAGARIIDARPAAQYAAGHVPSAASVYWGTALASPDRPTLRPPAELRALYDAAGVGANDVTYHVCNSGMQASLGYFIARYLGHEARLYDGAMADWAAAGLPISTGDPR